MICAVLFHVLTLHRCEWNLTDPSLVVNDLSPGGFDLSLVGNDRSLVGNDRSLVGNDRNLVGSR